MATTNAETAPFVVVDTNVLLAATDRSRSAHQGSLRLLNEDVRRLAISPQIVREYLAVATRPVGDNGLGLSIADAVANVEQLLEGMAVLTEGPATVEVMMNLVVDVSVVGKQVHDANVVAVALTHQAGTIVTDNTRHFVRFAHLIQVEDLDGTVVDV